MKLYAISDLHLRNKVTLQALEDISPHPGDWLIVAGDVGELPEHLDRAFRILRRRFARLFWVPGNHELWSIPGTPAVERGVGKYEQLVELCQQLGVLTPEDPFVEWPGAGPPCVIALLFLLYDYTFRPDDVAAEDVLAWSEEKGIVCTDEVMLHPAPYTSRQAWCAARCDYSEGRLGEIPDDKPTVLINHWALRQDLLRLRLIPRFSPWCGTRRTEDWHLRYRAQVVVHGHQHVRHTYWRDGVRFEEVSLGYPRQWDQKRGIGAYLREILPGPPPEDQKEGS
jgi:predicted phosphodiesterase